MTAPLVSIIVPVYKVEPYLRRCLDSLSNQTYTHLEIILVDDGSPDGCPQICDEYAAQDNRIVVIHKENGGVSDARNVGLDICKGKFIAFVDSDDWVEQQYAETLLAPLLSENADISIGNHRIFSNEKENFPIDELKSGMFSNQEIINEMFTTRNQYKILWGKIFRKELFDNVRFPVGKIYEDEYAGYIPYFFAKKIFCINQILYHYQKRSDSITGKDFLYDDYDIKISQVQFLMANNYLNLANQVLISLSLSHLNKFYEQNLNNQSLQSRTNTLKRLQYITSLFNYKSKMLKRFSIRFAVKHPQLYLFYKKAKKKLHG